MRQMYTVLDELVPDCQWQVLEMPGVLAPPVRDLILPAVRLETPQPKRLPAERRATA
ncbi:hypothetical protein ABT116_11325 [Streptomyces sp. NPDC002130]|uniref:hypothetical protein n=1 Tax=Streptomyces sp. NPDC002130 TaxID=3155568 RepID=UPI00332A1FF6